MLTKEDVLRAETQEEIADINGFIATRLFAWEKVSRSNGILIRSLGYRPGQAKGARDAVPDVWWANGHALMAIRELKHCDSRFQQIFWQYMMTFTSKRSEGEAVIWSRQGTVAKSFAMAILAAESADIVVRLLTPKEASAQC